ncbi:MAG: menaquinone biosynthesis decarboxylase, partial [Bacteroidales bacterium]|nr:menaquinone biosynthesis decarboxylase [Bacteroidales bacterium]
MKVSGNKGLRSFIHRLEQQGELLTIDSFVDPVLEISEITDRVTKSGGQALLFNNTGTNFPLLINTFGSDRRMAMALGRPDMDEAAREIEELFGAMQGGTGKGMISKLRSLPKLMKYAGFLPKKRSGRGVCQQVVMKEPDLAALPVLKCWPDDGGRFITLPCVHTFNPETGSTNVGMYRMQVFDKVTTGMHWHRHKTGASHYEAWKRKGLRMPVAVTLGGDPVYTYSATAPLPENIDEYILAGFLRRKRVKLVKCLTQDIWVPEDADIVIEGYVDPAEDLRWEGPFGDHTGVYSLADWYPAFHVTAITHAHGAVYPATIVGIPPQEDAWIGKATERLFLAPIKLTLAPEIVDIHMPYAGVAHNLVIVRIEKRYPGQGMKVLNTLYGAGQMMFSKFIIVVSGQTDIRNFAEVLKAVERNCSFSSDLLFLKGPLDVLDHSSDTFSFGGKMGIDATEKLPEETSSDVIKSFPSVMDLEIAGKEILKRFSHMAKDCHALADGVLTVSISREATGDERREFMVMLSSGETVPGRSVIILLEDGLG